MATTKDMTPVAAVLEALPLAAAVKSVPIALHRALTETGRLDTRILGLEREYAVRSAYIAADVVDRRGADNKPLATNDMARKALIEQETAEDSECQRLLSELSGLKRERSAVQADAEVLRVTARLVAAGAESELP
ncbi:MAG TPA: hypothetical protein VGM51_06975 [Armatimonadota bacterium]|jgi:hypothetical protein